MNRACLIKHSWLPAVVLLCCLPALAATVYRTVDANGVVRFSDSKPESDAPVETLVIDTPAPQPGDISRQRLRAMREISERMAADRMAREKHRLELRLLEAQIQPPQQPAYQPDDSPVYFTYPLGYSGYYNYPPPRSWKRWHRRQREHSITGPSRYRPSQGQRTRARHLITNNDYPASRIRKR
ncbi:MAG: DUF4124 domain-containing protein [Gammaproteobacteria bacterium]